MAFVMAPTGFQGVMQPTLGPMMMQPQQQQQQQQQMQSMMLLAPMAQPQQQFPGSAAGSLELYKAVESLYRDGLKPYGRILRKRLAEQSQAMGRGSAEMDVNSLKAACQACPYLHVTDGEGGDWAVLLPGVPEAFVDVYSPQDCYPQELWRELGAYLSSLDGADMILPGGRYSCAQVLVQRHLPCLATCTLGQVCHIVQLAISQKKLLGYLNGMVVPYHRSLSRVKEQSARSGLPCTNTARRSKASALATWDMMRPCLQQLLSAAGQPMPLSNLKRLFRVQFHVELSETALGYAKLSECLQDPRVRDLCDVKLQGQGYTIVPAKKPVQRSLISLADSLCMGPESAANMGQVAQVAQPGLVVQPGLVAAEAMRHPQMQMPQVAPVVARDPEVDARSTLLQRRRGRTMDLSMDVIDSEESSPTDTTQANWPATISASPSMCTSTRNGLPCSTPARVFPPTPSIFPPTPSPTAFCSRSLPRLLGRVQQPRFSAGGVKDLDVCKEEVGYTGGEFQAPVPAPQNFDALMPAHMSTMGLSVHNTFLHAPLPPPTPVREDARLRASSLPRRSLE